MNASEAQTVNEVVGTLKKQNQSLIEEVAYLKEQLAWYQRQIFGRKSERIVKDLDASEENYLPGFKELFEKYEEPKEEPTTVKSHKRSSSRKGKDEITYPDNLPVERIELDLPEEKKICPITGTPLVKIGEEISRKLALTPGCYFIKEYVRPKYATPSREEDGVLTAELPDGILPKCRVDESLLADIIVKKFGDHLPLYRISEILSRNGIRISRQLLSQWVVKIGQALTPLYDLMLERVLESENIFVDETPVGIQVKGLGKLHQAYMWTLVGGKNGNPPYRVYDFQLNRKHDNIIKKLKDYKGNLHSDKYGAYEKLSMKPEINWCPCMAHARRKFEEVESGDLTLKKWVLMKIRHLYMLERVAWKRSPEERLRIRREKEVPIIDQLIEAIKAKLHEGKILPKSKLRTALGYFCGLIPHLKNYTKDPFARLDKNLASYYTSSDVLFAA